LVKLVVDEAGSPELRDLVTRTNVVSCSLLRTELRRAAARVRTADVRPLTEEVLARAGILLLDNATLDRAGALSPPTMRSLDAIHLAVALRFSQEISAVVTYDARMATAARLHGFDVWSPGAGL